MNIVFQNDIGYTAYDADEKIIYYRNSGIVKSELIIEHLLFVEEFSKERPVKAAIADITQLRGSFRKMFDFFRNTHYPIMRNRGQLCSAIVVSEDLITHFLSEEMRDLSTQVTVRNFLLMDEAETWVKTFIHKQTVSTKNPAKKK